MSGNIRLDSKDMKILSELDKNARQPNSSIGRKVRLSKEVVKYRIDRMLKNGIIVRFYTLTNYFKLGISKYKLYLSLREASGHRTEEMHT